MNMARKNATDVDATASTAKIKLKFIQPSPLIMIS